MSTTKPKPPVSGTPAPSSGIPPKGALWTVAVYALRACLPTNRRLGLLLPSLGAVVFGLLAHVVRGHSPQNAFAGVAAVGLFPIVLPIGCLIIGDAVLGAEVRGGTMHYTWLSPVSRGTIVAGRWLAGTVAAMATVGLGCVLAAVAAGVPELAPAMAVAAGAGCAGYVAVFVLLGSVTRRAVVWSLAFVVLFEHLLGSALDGIAQLSPGWLARAAYAGIASGAEDLIRAGVPDGGAAVFRLVALSAALLFIAARRLTRLRLTGRSD